MPNLLAEKKNLQHQPDRVPGGDQQSAPRTYTSDALFGGQTEITISHADALYKLRITRQGKLILNK